MKKLTHVNKLGKISMVNVGHKRVQARTSKACGHIKLNPDTIKLIKENNIQKGDVLTTAEIAGIQAAKQTHHLIPLCHPLQITRIDVKATLDDTGISVKGEARCIGQTGIEMESLTGVSVALLTIYDMCKSIDKHMVIDEIRLLEKTKSDI